MKLSPSSRKRVIRLALIAMIEPLRQLIEDVLRDGGLRYKLSSRPGACDLVVVAVCWGDAPSTVMAARALTGDAPMLAILPFGDDELAEQVLLAGAQGCFALDLPMARLRSSLAELASLAA